ncbi:hypothetical protein MHB42_15530 [Lysinibacillus sp. FSL K6-0232]|uniref:hypothetical protein n=1 Tax=Lysinibacillus sp. FSL K6-0232 TaxID=2921425 RepID=UPI0030FC6F2F
MTNLVEIISRTDEYGNFFNENGYEGQFKKFSKIGQLIVKVKQVDTGRYFSWTYNLKLDNYATRIVNDMATLIPSPFSQNENLQSLSEQIKMEIDLS